MLHQELPPGEYTRNGFNIAAAQCYTKGKKQNTLLGSRILLIFEPLSRIHEAYRRSDSTHIWRPHLVLLRPFSPKEEPDIPFLPWKFGVHFFSLLNPWKFSGLRDSANMVWSRNVRGHS